MNLDKSQLKKDYVWNTLGSMMSALASVLLLIGVTQVLGSYDGGVFAIAFAIAQQFQTVGQYETRVYQATDIQKEHPFGIYFATKIVTCSAMIICIVVYALLANGFSSIALVFILVGCMRFFDAFEDVFHGLFQLEGRLDIAGKAFFFRTLVTTVSFFIGIALSRNLIIGCATSVIASAIAMILVNIPELKSRTKIKPIFQFSSIKTLLLACFPLFLGSFLFAYLTNAPKYGIEFFMNPEAQAYFAILFMPAMVINLISGFIFKPLLTSMAKIWHSPQKKSLFKYVFYGFAASGGITLVVIAIALPIGTPILSFIYGIDVKSYTLELIILLISGGFNAASIIAYYALVVIRRQKQVTVTYGIASVLISIFVFVLVPRLGLLGASLAYLGGMICLTMIFLVFVFLNIRKAPEDHDRTLPETDEKDENGL